MFQLFPEIEQQFINHHFGRIKKKWHVINQAGNSIDLTFNNHYELPLIKKGWNQFKTGNNLPDNVEIVLNCYGPRFFILKSWKQINNPSEIPSFNSRSVDPTLTSFFDIQLNADTILSNELVEFFYTNSSLL
jgi:hypothetical protein